MDILTAKGQITVEQEAEAGMMFEAATGFRYVNTPKNKPAVVDALLIQDGVLGAIAETKCRMMSLVDFDGFDYRWLVTFDKISKAKQLSEMLCVPLVGILYLVPDKTLLYRRLTNADGSWACNFHTEDTQTQATVNGGKAVRKNTFIDMSDAKVLKG
jgi:hypothetical protein